MKSAREILGSGDPSITWDYVCPTCGWVPRKLGAEGVPLAPPATQVQIHNLFKESIERGELDEIREKQSPAEIEAEVRALKKKRVSEGLLAAGAPWRTVDAIMYGPKVEDTAARRAVVEFMESEKSLLLLSGGVGTGKTVASVIGLGIAQRKGLRGCYFNSDAIAINIFEAESKDLVEKAQKAEFVVIDDLGVEAANPYWLGIVDSIVSARYRQDIRSKNGFGKAILSTNLDPKAFRERYGERVTDRINEAGRVVVCGVRSMRVGT